MKNALLTCALSILLFSCKKEETASPDFSEARYRVEITGKWTTPQFGVPANVHFTPVLGMVHDKNQSMWKENVLATPGVEGLAETGGLYPLLTEIDSYIAAGRAISIVVIPVPPPTGTSTANIYCNSNYSLVSFQTMLAPTPDWFTGVSGFDLYAGGKWVTDTTINLYPWDAGTEEGDVFSYDNPPTVPQRPVHLLSASDASVLANGNLTLAPIATMKFTRQ
jgi:hypothetical protein